MELSKSSKRSRLPEANQDRISNLPSIAIDKILECLPLPMVARMSVLSTEWRAIWLSHKYLVFDVAFWKGQRNNASRVSSAISNILLLHNGPIHKFLLLIPQLKGKQFNLNQYLSFLSRTCVKSVDLINMDERVANLPIPSQLFACKEFVELRLEYFTLKPPRGFKGFAHLCSLKLINIEFKHDILGSLITSCPRLELLWFKHCTGITNLVLDAPNLEGLVVIGGLYSLHFRNVARLSRTVLFFEPTEDSAALQNVFNSFKLLATSCELQYLECQGDTCQLLAAGGYTNLLSLSFNHLKELYLTEVDLGDLNMFRIILGLIQRCPCIKDLDILVTENTTNVSQHNIEFNDSYKLNHLMTMKITGITGSSAELKFLEYVLSVAVVLESLYFRCENLDSNSELKVYRDLLRLERASTKAKLVYLDQ